jgi:hypothetical protein
MKFSIQTLLYNATQALKVLHPRDFVVGISDATETGIVVCHMDPNRELFYTHLSYKNSYSLDLMVSGT